VCAVLKRPTETRCQAQHTVQKTRGQRTGGRVEEVGHTTGALSWLVHNHRPSTTLLIKRQKPERECFEGLCLCCTCFGDVELKKQG
jgi:hypothetical protein